MAEAVIPERSEEGAAQQLPRLDQPRAVHGGRFLIGYIVVILMAGAALVAIALMNRTDTSPSSPGVWSDWSPHADGFQAAREIAGEIASRLNPYRTAKKKTKATSRKAATR